MQSAEQTLEQLLPNIPDHADGSLGTCAIVGNADNLSGKGWGRQIDAHDFVVRYNVEVKGFEKDVGHKKDGIWTKARLAALCRHVSYTLHHAAWFTPHVPSPPGVSHGTPLPSATLDWAPTV